MTILTTCTIVYIILYYKFQVQNKYGNHRLYIKDRCSFHVRKVEMLMYSITNFV